LTADQRQPAKDLLEEARAKLENVLARAG
jgi:hypothetical protein